MSPADARRLSKRSCVLRLNFAASGLYPELSVTNAGGFCSKDPVKRPTRVPKPAHELETQTNALQASTGTTVH